MSALTCLCTLKVLDVECDHQEARCVENIVGLLFLLYYYAPIGIGILDLLLKKGLASYLQDDEFSKEFSVT